MYDPPQEEPGQYINDLEDRLHRAQGHLDDMNDLFNEYRDDLGLTNADFPGDKPEDRAIEFEQKFCALQCEQFGHMIMPDQHGPRTKGYCDRCHQMI